MSCWEGAHQLIWWCASSERVPASDGASGGGAWAVGANGGGESAVEACASAVAPSGGCDRGESPATAPCDALRHCWCHLLNCWRRRIPSAFAHRARCLAARSLLRRFALLSCCFRCVCCCSFPVTLRGLLVECRSVHTMPQAFTECQSNSVPSATACRMRRRTLALKLPPPPEARSGGRVAERVVDSCIVTARLQTTSVQLRIPLADDRSEAVGPGPTRWSLSYLGPCDEVSPLEHTRRQVSLCAGLTFQFAHVSPLFLDSAQAGLTFLFCHGPKG